MSIESHINAKRIRIVKVLKNTSQAGRILLKTVFSETFLSYFVKAYDTNWKVFVGL